MKEKKELYNQAMALLEGCNKILKNEPQIGLINTRLSGVVKDLNEIILNTVTNNQVETK